LSLKVVSNLVQKYFAAVLMSCHMVQGRTRKQNANTGTSFVFECQRAATRVTTEWSCFIQICLSCHCRTDIAFPWSGIACFRNGWKRAVCFPGTTSAFLLYLENWSRGLDQAAASFEPDIVYFLAGADPFVGDTLGGLAVSKAGLAERDRTLFELCWIRKWPLVIVMAGGYAANIDDIVDIQFQTIASARDLALRAEARPSWEAGLR